MAQPDPYNEKKKNFEDAIFGREDEISDELAIKILNLNNIDETELLPGFKARIQERLRNISPNDQEAANLLATLRNITEYQKKTSPGEQEPRNYIKELFDGCSNAFRKPILSFHNRQDGEMPDEDRLILDQLKEELNDDSEQQ